MDLFFCLFHFAEHEVLLGEGEVCVCVSGVGWGGGGGGGGAQKVFHIYEKEKCTA